MAETAKVINPDKKVLLPEVKDTQCPMAHQLPKEIIIEYKKRYNNAPLVVYVNTTAETKAMADIVCTSANALKVVESLEEDVILFGPDKNLAYYVQKNTDKKVIPIPKDGGCYVHQLITIEDVKKVKEKYPDAILLVHPECNPEIQDEADYILSTSGMVKKVIEEEGIYIIGTEVGLIDRIKYEIEKKGLDNRELIPLNENAICKEMKQITLEKLYRALKEEIYEVVLSDEIIEKAKKPIEKMLKL